MEYTRAMKIFAAVLAVIALALVVYAQDKVPSDIGTLDKERVEKAFKRPSRIDRFGDPLPSGALMRIGTIRYRAGASINKAAISPDGKSLAAAHEGGITVIELATGRSRPLRETGV